MIGNGQKAYYSKTSEKDQRRAREAQVAERRREKKNRPECGALLRASKKGFALFNPNFWFSKAVESRKRSGV